MLYIGFPEGLTWPKSGVRIPCLCHPQRVDCAFTHNSRMAKNTLIDLLSDLSEKGDLNVEKHKLKKLPSGAKSALNKWLRTVKIPAAALKKKLLHAFYAKDKKAVLRSLVPGHETEASQRQNHFAGEYHSGRKLDSPRNRSSEIFPPQTKAHRPSENRSDSFAAGSSLIPVRNLKPALTVTDGSKVKILFQTPRLRASAVQSGFSTFQFPKSQRQFSYDKIHRRPDFRR
jgi:hypothetical protein